MSSNPDWKPNVNPGAPIPGSSPWMRGDVFDNRGQFLQQVKRDTGVDPSVDGIPLTTKGKAYVWGKISAALGISPGAASTILRTNSAGAVGWGKLFDAYVDAAAAIAYGKLNLTGSIVNADIAAAAAIAYSKLNLAGSITSNDITNGTITGADIANNANIPWYKMTFGGVCKVGNPAGAVTTTGAGLAITWGANPITDLAGIYAVWNGVTAVSCITAGLVRVDCCILWPVHATGYRQCQIRVNGAVYYAISLLQTVTVATVQMAQSCGTFIRLAAGDYIECIVQQGAGVNLTIAADPRSYMSMHWISN